jgi:exocyst complex component 6
MQTSSAELTSKARPQPPTFLARVSPKSNPYFLFILQTTELNELRGISQNINSAIEVLSTCMYTLGLCAKVKEYVENKKFYPAIKILDQLQQVHLRNVAQFEFGRQLEKRIPLIKDSIKKRVMADVNEWLLQIRNKGGRIGKFAMEQTQAEIRQRDELLKLRQMDARDYTNAIISQRTRTKLSGSGAGGQGGHISADASDITEQSVFENSMVQVTFAPLYQCSYIFESLGEKDEFRKYYRENRKLQSRLVLQMAEGKQFIQDYESFLQEIVGFFIIEATVLQTSNDLISAYDVSMLWDAAVNKVKSILQVEVAYCADISLLPKLKDFLLVLARTLRKYGFDLAAITDFVRAPLRDRFILVALSQLAAQFERVRSSADPNFLS